MPSEAQEIRRDEAKTVDKCSNGNGTAMGWESIQLLNHRTIKVYYGRTKETLRRKTIITVSSLIKIRCARDIDALPLRSPLFI